MTPTPRTTVVGGVLGAVLALALAACAAPAPPADGPDPEQDLPGHAATWREVVVGGLVLHVADDVQLAEPDAGPDGTTLAVPAATDGPTPGPREVLALPDGTVARLEDGTVTLTQETDGARVQGGVVLHPGRPGVRLGVDGATVTVVTSPGAAPVDDEPLTLWISDRGARSLTWGELEGGRSLVVAPTDWARAAGAAGVEAVWAQMQQDDEAATPGMYDQLLCHALGAPDKETWNLEPWRPDAGLVGVLAAACNPT